VALGAGVTTKSDDSPLTEADLAAHHVIVGALNSADPRTPVVSEEDESSHQHRQAHGEFWLIDPLDGTKEFIARNGEFTVNIALVRDGVAVLGAVFAPVTGELFMGGAALGSTKATVSVARAPLSTVPTSSCERVSGSESRPIRVRAQRPDEPLRIVASKSHMTDETRAYIERLGRHSLVQAGSSLKFCRVAEGSADCYPRIGPTAEWDTAAAQAVVEGAGGVVHDLHGQRLLYGKAVNRNDGFVASAWPMPPVRAGVT
jgi:3'(2'), 5'-bisphosphate nucleotidase